MSRKWILLALSGALLGAVFAGCQVTRAGYESAPYQVVRSDGRFQLRDYPSLTVVETPMKSVGGADDDGSFMRLFRFITGKNATQQEIPMTTPVFMAGGGTNETMAFVMPADMNAGTVPPPTDPSVTVRELPAGRFAVYRFSGGRNDRRESEALERLKAWMEAEHLVQQSTPVYGYFDPPWIPAFLCRNEVMLRISAGDGSGVAFH